jgi:hypothetical protein
MPDVFSCLYILNICEYTVSEKSGTIYSEANAIYHLHIFFY